MRLSAFVSVFVVSSLSLLYACGGSDGNAADASDSGADDDGGRHVDASRDAGPDVDNGSPSTTYPAFKVDPPQVVSQHGPVLAAPKIVPVYFHNDDTAFTTSVTTFLKKLPASTYWGPAETEYGVGAITVTDPVQLTDDAVASLDDSAIQTFLANEISTNTSWPAPDANTIYALFYPPATTSITLGQGGGTSCQDWGGYHQDILSGGTTHVAYAVIPRCTNFDGFTGLDAVTAAASHEIIEASTDPYPVNAPAYEQVDDNHIIWEFLLGGGEVSDMCAQSRSSYYSPADVGATVTRSWSNAAAKAGHDPCVPTDGTPYFNSMPLLAESVNIPGLGTTKGVNIAIGATKTIEVDLFSDAPTSGAWTVDAVDSATLQGTDPELALAWDRTSGVNGEKLHLTITVLKQSQYGAEGFIITSSLGERQNLWAGIVGNGG